MISFNSESNSGLLASSGRPFSCAFGGAANQNCPSEPSSSQWSWSSFSASRFICQLRSFSSPFLRALWLGAVVIFISRSYQSEMLLPRILDGAPHTVSEYLTVSDRAVALFPFDQHIRNSRLFIRRRIQSALEQGNATGEPGAATMGMGEQGQADEGR